MLQRPIRFSLSNTAVGATLEDISGYQVNDINPARPDLGALDSSEFLTAEIKNTGSAALTNFVVMVKTHPEGAWITAITGAGWATASNFLNIASSGLNTLAAGATGWIRLSTTGFFSVKFQASCGTTTSLTIKGTGS
jgi:hypothetical protein